MAVPTHAPGVVDTPPPLAARAAAALFADSGPRPVLDPACGTGALLLAALDRAEGSAAFASEALFGLERCPRRLGLARRRLVAAVRDASAAELRRVDAALARHLRCADALDPATEWPADTAVLANPPWQSLSGRQAARLEPERRELYRRSWRAARHGWPSLHGAFLERCAGHLAKARDLRAAVLVPRAVLELERYEPLRRELAARVALEPAALDLGEDAFPGVVQPAALLFLASTGGKAAQPGRPADGIVAALAAHPRLPEGTFADPGVHTGNAARDLVHSAAGESPFPVAPLRAGRDLTPFRLGSPRQLLRLDLERTKELRFRIPPLERLAGFPILLRQTASRPLAARHTEPTYFRNSLLACRGAAGLDPDFLVGVLNSDVLAAWHRERHADSRQRSFPQVKVRHLAALPVPFSDRARSPRRHDEIARLARALEASGGEDEAAREALERQVLNAFGLTEPVAVP